MADENLRSQSVGVFDSGVGGLSVLAALLEHLPHERFDFVADERYLPYGDKPQHEISDRVLTLSNWLHNKGCKAMVMACNTATAAAAGQARARPEAFGHATAASPHGTAEGPATPNTRPPHTAAPQTRPETP